MKNHIAAYLDNAISFLLLLVAGATPLLFLNQTGGAITITKLKKELRVTYKTAWRIYTTLHKLMELNNGDLLTKPNESRLLQWTFFNKFEIKVVEKEEKG